MSLINKVLRDLEAHREASENTRIQQSPLVDAGLHPVRRVHPRLSRTQLVRIGLLLALPVVAALAWLQWGSAFFGSGKPSPVAPAPAPIPQKTAVVPPPQEIKPAAVPAPVAKPQHRDVLVAVPTDAKPQHTDVPSTVPRDAKLPEPAKTPAAAAPVQDVVVRKPLSESTKADVTTLKATEGTVTAKAQPGHPSPAPLASIPSAKVEPPVIRKPEAAPAESAEQPDKVAEEPEEAPAPKAPAVKAVLEKKLKPLTPEERAESEYRLAATALQQRRTGEAESRLRAALAAQPSHVKARELLAGLALQGGRWREAQSLLEQGVTLNPNHYPFAQLLARSYVDHGQEQKALELLEKSRAAAGTDPEYLAFLATLYQRAGRQDDAARNFSEALKQRPREGRWWLGLAISLEAVEKWKESAEAYERATASGSLDKQLLRYSQQRLAVVKNK